MKTYKVDKLETAIGDFWIEADGKKISFIVIDGEAEFAEFCSKYKVNDRKILVPDLSKVKAFNSLKMQSSLNLSEWREVDVVSDEFYAGWQWEKDGITFGVAVFVNNGDLDFLVDCSTSKAFPFYIKSEKRFMGAYRFSLAIKDFVSDEDLSVDFALDFFGSEMP
ncbi:hypothetical protein [Rummeliibacillus suwonensis]|uniref:hypothetical protein n=1 Tax=Rummeliibacillus suwonensis TaxID=1306154 RepID=UPI001AAE3A24|nr:hypothetical protein [Rummeliibacillus suwonensis]MBO2536526.1 hypothetical protein [Rummeliibacillus suwonensis]